MKAVNLVCLLVVLSLAACGGPAVEPPPAGKALQGPLVVSSNWPRTTDLVSWAGDIWRIEGLAEASETRRAIVLFNWVRLYNQVCMGGPSQMVEGPPGEEAYVQDPHKTAFVYGWGFCDTHSRIMEALWQEYKNDPDACIRVCCKSSEGGYHTMYRLLADGGYQAYDCRFAFYLLAKDSPEARVLDWHEVGVDSNVTMNEQFVNRQPVFWEASSHRDYILKIEPVFWEKESEWSAAGKPAYNMFASPMHKLGTRYHDMDWSLARGMKIERFWDNSARQFYRPIWHMDNRKRPEFLPAGRFHSFYESRSDSIYKHLDPNWIYTEPYHMEIPAGEGYPEQAAGDRALGQAWGRTTYTLPLDGDGWSDLLAAHGNIGLDRETGRLRPVNAEGPAEAVFDFYCPYIMTEGTFSGTLAGGPGDDVKLEIRTLTPKAHHRDQPDRWSDWTGIASGPGQFSTTLGYDLYEQKKNTVHGKYRFQLRLTAAAGNDPREVGLDGLEFSLYFENGIMTLPQLAAGHNEVSVELDDGGMPAAPLTVGYRWQTDDGREMSSNKVLQPGDFTTGRASFALDAPGLAHCRSVSISY